MDTIRSASRGRWSLRPKGVPHELELFQALAGRVGLGAEFAGSIDDWKRRLLARVSPGDLARGVAGRRGPQSGEPTAPVR